MKQQMPTTTYNTPKEAFKFSFDQIFSNETGKTSATKFIGVINSIVMIAAFIAAMIFYFFNPGEATTIMMLIDKMTTFFAIGAGILGVKSISTAFNKHGQSIIKIGECANNQQVIVKEPECSQDSQYVDESDDIANEKE